MLEVQYRTTNTTNTTQQISPQFNIINKGSSGVNLQNVTVRYWFTKEMGPTQQVLACDYAKMTCAKVSGSFTEKMGQDATHYLEVKFTSHSLKAGASTGEIQLRFYMQNYQGQYTQNNDYSFDANISQFTAHQKVTAYHNGVLVWGNEP